MSTKYQVEHIRAVVVEHLETDWPGSLEEWDMIWGATSPRRVFMPFQAPEPCSIINLARKYDTPHILPAAFYALSCIDLRHEEWDPRGPSREIDGWRWDSAAQARWSLLSSPDMLTLMKVKDSIRSDLLTPFKINRGPDAASACTCGQTWLDQHCHLSILVRQRDPLRYLKLLMMAASSTTSIMCAPCRIAIRDTFIGRRKAIWQSLREDFDLLECKFA